MRSKMAKKQKKIARPGRSARVKKPARAAKKTVVRAAAAPRAAAGEVQIGVDPGSDGVEPIYGAAYLMIDRAFVLVEPGAGRSLRVTLRPKGDRSAAALSALREAFAAEHEAQKLRWAIARNNLPLREYVAENALALAEEFSKRAAAAPAAAAPVETLTDDQRAEIERLIAEVETEIKTMNERRDHDDAKKVAQSWEAGRADGGEKPA